MAQVPYNEGIPEVLPQTSMPNDYLRVETTPMAFGGGIAQGLEKLGAGGTTAGRFWGQIQTDDVLNSTMAQGREVVENFKKLSGADALNAQADVHKQLNKVLANGESQLSVPEQLAQYKQQSRLFFERFLAPQVDNHANQQGRIHEDVVNESTAKQGLDIIGANPTDEDSAAYGRSLVLKGRIRQAQSRVGTSGLDNDTADTVIRQANAEALTNQINALLANNNPLRAQAILKANPQVLGGTPNYDALSQRVERASNELLGAQQGEAYIRQATIPTPAVTNPATDSWAMNQIKLGVDAIHLQESSGQEWAPTSAAGAVGAYQIKPATWAQYTQPGEHLDINNVADQRTIAERIFRDGVVRSGGNAAGGFVAYVSGANNVAPPGSPNPWKEDRFDPNSGISTSQYVAQATSKMQRANMLDQQANVLDQVDKELRNKDPGLWRATRSYVTERYQLARMEADAQKLQQQNASEKAVRSIEDQIFADPSKDIESTLAANPNLTGSQVEHLRGYRAMELERKLNGGSGDYGDRYSDIQTKIFNGQIRDPEQLRSFLGNGLNATGYKEALGILKLSQSEPGAQMMMENFFEQAKAKIVPFKGIGLEDRWNKALPAIWDYINKERSGEQALPWGQLFDPNNKQSAWTIVDGYVHDPATQAQKLVDNTVMPIAPAEANKANWDTLIKYPPRGFNTPQWQHALLTLMEHHSPKDIGDFNAAFPGFRGDEVIEKLLAPAEQPVKRLPPFNR